MRRIHYLLLGLALAMCIAAVAPSLPPTRIAPGTNITVVTNGVNSFTLSASGGGGSSVTNLGNGADTVLLTNAIAYSSGTNRAMQVIGGTVTNSNPLEFSQTWNNATGVFTGLLVNVTNTSSSANSKLFDIVQDGVSKLALLRDNTSGNLRLVFAPIYSSVQTYPGNAFGVILGYNNYYNGGIFLGGSTLIGANVGDGSGVADIAIRRRAAGEWAIDSGTVDNYRDLVVRSLNATNAYVTNLVVGGGSTVTKFITATATLNFDNSTAFTHDLTMTVTGAVPGDVVQLGFKDAVAAGFDNLFIAWVSSNDTVTIRSYSINGDNPPPAVFRVTVTKH
jgi:hypothetical protein